MAATEYYKSFFKMRDAAENHGSGMTSTQRTRLGQLLGLPL